MSNPLRWAAAAAALPGRGACYGDPSPLWITEPTTTQEVAAIDAYCAPICATCPVLAACRDYALTGKPLAQYLAGEHIGTYGLDANTRARLEAAATGAPLPERTTPRLRRRVRNTSKTHCINGHEYTPENTATSVQNGSVKRRCRECARLYDRAYYRRSKAA